MINKNHNVIEFAPAKSIEEIAVDWLIKMDGDNSLSKQQQAEFSLWINDNPQHSSEFFELCEIWDGVPVEQVHKLLAQHISVKQPTSTIKSIYALCGLFVITILAWMITSPPTQEYLSNGVYLTNIGEQSQQALQDGSVIHLNTNSRVQVEYTDNARNVWLTYGEAHFEVAKNPDKPFRVYAAGGRVQAVGTAFTIKINDNLLDVLVTEGRIAVATGAKKHIPALSDKKKTDVDANQIEQVLTKIGELDAGQSIKIANQYNIGSADDDLAPSIQTLDQSEVIRRQAWRSGLLLFDGQTMSEFIEEISRFTHVSFIIDDPSVAAMKIGGRYKLDKLDQVLTALEENFDIDVSQVGNSSYRLTKKVKI